MAPKGVVQRPTAAGKGGSSKGKNAGKGKGNGVMQRPAAAGKGGSSKGKGADLGPIEWARQLEGQRQAMLAGLSYTVVVKDGDNGMRGDIELEVKASDTIANVKAKITRVIGEPDGVGWYLESRGRGLEDQQRLNLPLPPPLPPAGVRTGRPPGGRDGGRGSLVLC
jgi:hypothetical protein